MTCGCGKSTPEQPAKTTIDGIKLTSKSLPSVFTSVMIAFFPKCPLCWGVYMSTFSGIGLSKLPYSPWLLPVLIALFGLQLLMLARKIPQNGWVPFLLSLFGAATLLLCRNYFPREEWLLFTGMILIIAGSLLNSFSGKIRLSIFNKPTKQTVL